MRLAGSIKLGFYPTPQRIVDHIKQRLVPVNTEATLTFLDPCAGEGRALFDLSTHNFQHAIPYAIEPDRTRYRELKNVFNTFHCNALNSTLEDCTIAHNSFSCLYLNPPYDHHYDNQPDTGQDKTTKTVRKEIHFLRRTTPYLVPGGLLIFIVPNHILTPNLIEYLSSRFNNLDAYKFPEPEYQNYKQIVITGNKKPKPEPVPPTLELHDFQETNAPLLTLPPTSVVKLFKTSKPNPEDLVRILEPRLNDLLKTIMPTAHTELTNATPPLPLHMGHLSLLLAAGKINGVLGSGPDRHVVRGTVIKKISVKNETQPTESGSCHITTRRDNYAVSIKLLHQDGLIETLT